MLILWLITACTGEPGNDTETNKTGEIEVSENDINIDDTDDAEVFLTILGTIQDGGSPHVGCSKDCCSDLFENPDKNRMVVSLGVVDRPNEKTWIFEATPDFPQQTNLLKRSGGFGEKEIPDGIFLTHAHIGHYTGLMYLGKEACNAEKANVYAMPRMKHFLENNGPWSQLVKMENILIHELADERTDTMSSNVRVTPFLVPHRDEFSETVGFRIEGPNKSALFIPDIDKWEVWNKDILEEIKKVDYAFIDATFYGPNELKNRNMSEIPHPFIVESMELFQELDQQEKDKIHFIHLNHSNPAIDTYSIEFKSIENKGFNVAKLNHKFNL